MPSWALVNLQLNFSSGIHFLSEELNFKLDAEWPIFQNGKTTCKEVCSNCKCTIIEKPVQKKEEKKKDQCVATIVGVLQLPENFCCNQPKPEEKKEDDGGQEEVSILFSFIFIGFTKSRQKLELGGKYVLIFDFLFFAFFWLLNFFYLWVPQKQCWLCYLMTGYLLKNRCNFFFFPGGMRWHLSRFGWVFAKMYCPVI